MGVTSMPPGITIMPLASSTFEPSGSKVPKAATRPLCTAMSETNESAAVSIVPPLMTRS